MPKNNLSVVEPSLALFIDRVPRSIFEEFLQFEVDHLASAVQLDVCDCLPPSFESSVLDPKGVADEGYIISSECLVIAFVVVVNALQAAKEVNRLIVVPQERISEVPV